MPWLTSCSFHGSPTQNDVHIADLHIGHHLRRRHDDGGDVLVGIDAAGGQPIAQPQVVRASREGHRYLHFACRRPSSSQTLPSAWRHRAARRYRHIPCQPRSPWPSSRLRRARMAMRHRDIVLRDLAGMHQVGHRARGYARHRCRLTAPPSTRLSRVAPQEACFSNLDIRHSHAFRKSPISDRDRPARAASVSAMKPSFAPLTSGSDVAAKAPEGKAVRTAVIRAAVADVFRIERRLIELESIFFMSHVPLFGSLMGAL